MFMYNVYHIYIYLFDCNLFYICYGIIPKSLFIFMNFYFFIIYGVSSYKLNLIVLYNVILT